MYNPEEAIYKYSWVLLSHPEVLDLNAIRNDRTLYIPTCCVKQFNNIYEVISISSRGAKLSLYSS